MLLYIFDSGAEQYVPVIELCSVLSRVHYCI